MGCNRLEDNPAAQSLGDGFGFRVNMQLIVNAANVIAGSMDAYLKHVGSSLVGMAFYEEPEQTHFLWCQLFVEFFGWAGFLKQSGDFSRSLWRHRSAASMRLAYCL